MPISKSAIKRMRSDAKKRERNQAALSELKTLDKKLRNLVSEAPEKAERVAKELISKYDTYVSKGIVPKGRADRKKSRIAKLIRKSGEKSSGKPNK